MSIDYTRLSSKLTEYKKPENITETTRFHYNFITPQILLRFYAFPRFYMGAGISAAIPFGSRNIDFTNDRIGEVYRQQAERTQDHLRESVKARVTFIPTIKIGYVDIKNGLEAGCCGSVTDLFAQPFTHHPVVEKGLREAEAQQLLQAFFVSLREKRAGRPRWKPPVPENRGK